MLAADSANEAFDSTNAQTNEGKSEKHEQELVTSCGNRTHIITNPSDRGSNNRRDGSNSIGQFLSPLFFYRQQAIINSGGRPLIYLMIRFTSPATNSRIITPVK